MQDQKQAESNLLKGLIAGLAGGMVASVVMNQFQSAWQNAVEKKQKSHGAQSMQEGSPDHGAGRILQDRGVESGNDDATERLANVISETVFEHTLTEDEKKTAGTAFHYAYGVSMGGVYGATVEVLPQAAAGYGLAYGALIWLTADEGVLPLLGLSKSPVEYPLSTHAYALTSHFVYGLTAEIVRRPVRTAI